MPRWIQVLVAADVATAVLIALAMARVAGEGRFWGTFLKSAALLGIFFVLASFLVYFGGWLFVRGLSGG